MNRRGSMDHDRWAAERDKNSNGRALSQVQVIGRAVSILRVLRDTGGLNLSQLAREVGLARSTVHRIVNTLEAEHLVVTVQPTGRIELGIGLVSLGAAVKRTMRSELRPYLEALADEVGETIDLAVLENDRMVFVEQVARRLRLLAAVSGVGLSFPLHCTANGKAMLAELPPDQVERLVPERLEILTPNTLLDRASLLRELDDIRVSGIAYDREEHTLGISAVGTVVHGPLGEPGAISIPVPSVRFHGNEERLASALLRTREAIDLRFAGI